MGISPLLSQLLLVQWPLRPQQVLLTLILLLLEPIYIRELPFPVIIRVVQCFQVKLCSRHDPEQNLEPMLKAESVLTVELLQHLFGGEMEMDIIYAMPVVFITK